ncbi:choline O-acetyltransferase-like [Symsagittifera roscoffensis]|uniref:choline O-acetyltransferase-like n=1 Tax=Symsagittifera roscoffensis TaxID=84072 RepID=UPI00307B2CCA
MGWNMVWGVSTSLRGGTSAARHSSGTSTKHTTRCLADVCLLFGHSPVVVVSSWAQSNTRRCRMTLTCLSSSSLAPTAPLPLLLLLPPPFARPSPSSRSSSLLDCSLGTQQAAQMLLLHRNRSLLIACRTITSSCSQLTPYAISPVRCALSLKRSAKRSSSSNQWNDANRTVEEWSTSRHRSPADYNLNIQKQPMPDLTEALQDFLDKCKVVMTPGDYERLESLACEFVKSGRGPNLYEWFRDETRDHTNWSFKYWLRDMYLRNQSSLPLMSNAAIFVEQNNYKDKDQWLRYVAKFVVLLLNVRMQIITKTLPVEYVRALIPPEGDKESESAQSASEENNSAERVEEEKEKGKMQPLCMDQYTAAVSSYRRSGAEMDTHIRYSLNLDENEPTHIIVAHRGQLFALKVGCSGGRAIDEQSLFESLQRIESHQLSPPPPPPPPPPPSVADDDDDAQVGIGTAAHRKDWFELSQKLCQSKVNRKNLNIIESSFALVCLDTEEPSSGQIGTGVNRGHSESTLRQLLLGGGDKNVANRWYDKALQIISSSNGLFGVNMEHSIAEGVVWLRVIRIIQQMIKDEESGRMSSSDDRWKSNEILGCPKPLIWDVDCEAREKLHDIKTKFRSQSSDVKMDHINLFDLTKGMIKRANINPDIFVQIMLQLAYYRTHNSLCHSYESASLRRYDRGRADNIRSNSASTRRLIEALTSRNYPERVTDTRKLLYEACDVQQKQIDSVIRGQGADMLLQCLKDFCREKNVEDAFLQSEELASTFDFRLTTSQMSSGKSEQFAYYGPVSRDGYGVCYNLHDDLISLVVSSLNSSPHSQQQQFVEEIHNAKRALKQLACIQ